MLHLQYHIGMGLGTVTAGTPNQNVVKCNMVNAWIQSCIPGLACEAVNMASGRTQCSDTCHSAADCQQVTGAQEKLLSLDTC